MKKNRDWLKWMKRMTKRRESWKKIGDNKMTLIKSTETNEDLALSIEIVKDQDKWYKSR